MSKWIKNGDKRWIKTGFSAQECDKLKGPGDLLVDLQTTEKRALSEGQEESMLWFKAFWAERGAG